jgi:hypothetical protein
MSEQKPLAPLTGSAIGEAEKTRRRNILAGINARKRAKAKKRRMPNVELCHAAKTKKKTNTN